MGGADTGGANMGRPALTVVSQYVKDLSFESPRLLDYQRIKHPPRDALSMGVTVTGIAPDRFEVALAISASAHRNDVMGYILEFIYAGIFELQNFPAQQIDAILHIQAPELLFPSMRKILARLLQENSIPFDTSRHADFVAHYAEHLEKRSPGPSVPRV